jgi:tRNA A58 N-methylase Trm61
MLNLERATAELIQILVFSSLRKRVLEIGTSSGYSAIWLGAKLREIPGAHHLITIERDSDKVRHARANIAKAGLSEIVDVHEGSATEIVAVLPGPFDCVFLMPTGSALLNSCDCCCQSWSTMSCCWRIISCRTLKRSQATSTNLSGCQNSLRPQ